MPQKLIANARMYSVAPGAADAWKRLFAWLSRMSGVALTVVDHAFPAKLDDLWARDDLACTFMCGWPWLRLARGHVVVAAPVPAAAYAGGRSTVPILSCTTIVRSGHSEIPSAAVSLSRSKTRIRATTRRVTT